MNVLSKRRALRLVCAMVFGMCLPKLSFAANSMPRLQADATRMVNARGEPIILRGCNLGNWLLLESWMLKWDIEDDATINRTLASRFGESEAQMLMDIYRAGYITPRDFEIIKSFNFNCVRVPFNYTVLMDEEGQLRPNAFRWLDRALEMAEDAGIYVILDMHGAPGRQSIDHCSGERGKNRLWTDETAQQRMADLWRRIAERYKDRDVIAAYDLLNEPFGDFKSDMREPLRKLMPKLYEAVRSTGDQHVVLFPQALGRGISFYDAPADAGMMQVGFTDHFYPGLFGSPPTIASHAGMFARAIPDLVDYLHKVKAPMLVGEFNVVLHKAGGKPMMRKYYDVFAQHGWMATMWSYKILKPSPGVEPDNWYMATNAQPLPSVDVRTSSLAEIETFFASLATMPLAVDANLRTALTAPEAPPMPLPQVPSLPSSSPTLRAMEDWTLTDVEAAPASGIEVNDKTVNVFAGGSDIFGNRDSFAFFTRPCGENASLSATVVDVIETDTWTKAGLMLRLGDPSAPNYAAAPFVMVHAFPNGVVAFTVRRSEGEPAAETKRVIGPLPRKLMLLKTGERVTGLADAGDGSWLVLGETRIPPCLKANIGLAVCSHRDRYLTRATFADLSTDVPAIPLKLSQHAHPSSPAVSQQLLENPSFENTAQSFPTGWNRWGEHLGVTTSTVRTGTAAIEAKGGKASPSDSGLWQDVPANIGVTYQLSVFAQRKNDDVKDQSVSLAIEAEVDGRQVSLAERTVDLAEIEKSGGWSLVHLQCVAPSARLRVLLRAAVTSGGVVIDDVSLSKLGPSPSGE